jgi:uncharacterized protein YdcH (DUF465 family)
MNITLRKANAIQNSLQDAIKSIEIKFDIEINEFQTAEAEIRKANELLFSNDARRQRMLLSLYNIRGLVGTANTNSGIDLSLAKSAFIDKRIAQLEPLAKASTVTDLTIINGKLDKIRNDKTETRRASIYGYNDSVSTSVLSAEQVAQIKAEIQNLRKQKQKLNDEILELNIKTEIPLSEEVVATLQKEGLI